MTFIRNYYGFMHFLLLMACPSDEHEIRNKVQPENYPVFSVWYSPYAKQWNESGLPPTSPPKSSYTSNDIRRHLSLIVTKFNSIVTHGMGVTFGNYKRTWNKTYPECLIATEAAKVNRESNSLRISVLQGINFNPILPKVVKETEIVNSIISARHANSIYPSTVWGIVLIYEFENEYENENETKSNASLPLEVIEAIRNLQSTASNNLTEVEIGLSLQICDNKILNQLASHSLDFIVCKNIHSVDDDDSISLADVDLLVNKSINYFHTLANVNSNCSGNTSSKIILEDTGWPTIKLNGAKVHKGDVEKVRKFQSYWNKLRKWATDSEKSVILREAFDKPHYCAVYKQCVVVGQCAVDVLSEKVKRKCFLGWWVSYYDKNGNELFLEKVNLLLNTQQGFNTDEDWLWIWIGFGVFGAVFVISVVAVIIWTHMHSKNQKIMTESDIKQFLFGGEQTDDNDPNGGSTEYEALNLPYDQSLELAKDMILIDKNHVIGSGTFGTVYKGRLLNHKYPVAFKTLNRAAGSHELKDLLSEIKIMSYIGKHDHIVSLLGAYTSEIRKGVAYISLELCSKGSLKNYLRKHSTNTNHDDAGIPTVEYSNLEEPNLERRYTNGPSLYLELEPSSRNSAVTTEDMIRWSFEIASAMEYLEGKKVLHGDLATRNVLLTGDFHAKVTDFGLSRRLYEYTNYVKRSKEPLPWRWMSIESLTQLHFSSKTDCWSFGVTIWEIFTEGDVPYPGLNWTPDFPKLLEDGLRLSRPHRVSEDIFKIMSKCWNNNPDNRPSFQELVLFFDDQKKIGVASHEERERTTEYANLSDDLQHIIGLSVMNI